MSRWAHQADPPLDFNDCLPALFASMLSNKKPNLLGSDLRSHVNITLHDMNTSRSIHGLDSCLLDDISSRVSIQSGSNDQYSASPVQRLYVRLSAYYSEAAAGRLRDEIDDWYAASS